MVLSKVKVLVLEEEEAVVICGDTAKGGGKNTEPRSSSCFVVPSYS